MSSLTTPGAVKGKEDSAKSQVFGASERPESDEDDDDIPFDENTRMPDGSLGMQEKDRLLHWWCQRHLNRYLRKLKRDDNARPFQKPVPWQDLELDDYLEIVETPMDLRSVQERLDQGEYEDADGFINPELFWVDVALCWDNCLKYYEDDEELETCRMARTMIDIAEKLEDEFWEDLEDFEQKIEEVDPTLGGVAAAIDVASGTVEEFAGVAYDSIANWFKSVESAKKTSQQSAAPQRPKKLRFSQEVQIQEYVTPRKLEFAQRVHIQEYIAEFDNNAPESPLDYQYYKAPHRSLQEHFAEVLLLRYKYAAHKELEAIDVQIKNGINAAKKFVEGVDQSLRPSCRKKKFADNRDSCTCCGKPTSFAGVSSLDAFDFSYIA